jgi:hypothetical protein
LSSQQESAVGLCSELVIHRSPDATEC